MTTVAETFDPIPSWRVAPRVTVAGAAAAVSQALRNQDSLAIELPPNGDAQAAVEGALLARYEYAALRERPERTPLTHLIGPGSPVHT
ncbi:M17 family peptidase N-terminal domain-containing protein [Actinoplanes solisilvae]|uniref:M17 family peptidase N-terminal domain-containing protein n=1 Tax=Actinoplanes solisilvae TaxID=2486853 RepID=UPI000FD87145|nr:M17 family peptidase N-terminal domain-containing protein [Actinoplanes solisilvae]